SGRGGPAWRGYVRTPEAMVALLNGAICSSLDHPGARNSARIFLKSPRLPRRLRVSASSLFPLSPASQIPFHELFIFLSSLRPRTFYSSNSPTPNHLPTPRPHLHPDLLDRVCYRRIREAPRPPFVVPRPPPPKFGRPNRDRRLIPWDLTHPRPPILVQRGLTPY